MAVLKNKRNLSRLQYAYDAKQLVEYISQKFRTLKGKCYDESLLNTALDSSVELLRLCQLSKFCSDTDYVRVLLEAKSYAENILCLVDILIKNEKINPDVFEYMMGLLDSVITNIDKSLSV